MLFPLALYYKILDNDATKTLKYEIVYSLLSFLAKLPLLAVFIGGSFQRGLFTDIVDGSTSTVAPSESSGSFDGQTYLALFLPMGLALLGAAIIVYVMWFELELEDYGSRTKNFLQVGKIAGLCSLFLCPSHSSRFCRCSSASRRRWAQPPRPLSASPCRPLSSRSSGSTTCVPAISSLQTPTG